MVALKACRVHCPDCLRDISKAGFQFAGVHAINSVGRHALNAATSFMNVKQRAGLPVELVLVTKVKDPRLLAGALAHTNYKWLQLHAPWSVTELTELRARINVDVRLITLFDPETMQQDPEELLEVADMLIVDHEAGGTGSQVDKRYLHELHERGVMGRVFLAGGITPTNVGDLVDTYAPYGVDAQSGLLGPDGAQDFRRLVNLARAAAGTVRLPRVEACDLPLERYSSGVWAALTPRIATSEDLVAKVNLIEALESRSPYKLANAPFWPRVETSLNQLSRLSSEIEDHWLTAALVLFANVRYLEQEMLVDAWRGLFLQMLQHMTESASISPLTYIHLFENDPSGLTGMFCHVNHLEGRLDTQTLSRIEGTDRLADLLLGVFNPQTADIYAPPLRSLFQKPEWVLLVDKTLSGHSLRGDVARLMTAAEIAARHGHKRPRIWVLAQVATEQAILSVADLLEDYNGEIELRAAMRLTNSHSLSAPGSSLIQTNEVRDNARRLCVWFGDHVIARDPSLERMRARSGDNLEFGYRNCGLTLVDHENCPTDSLPILWYGSEGAPYTGPYPRVHSRVGGQSVELSQDKWETIARVSADQVSPLLTYRRNDDPRN